jgi:hypothetical protein
MTTPIPSSQAIAQAERFYKTCKKNHWLKGLGLGKNDLEKLQQVQNDYNVGLDDWPLHGHQFHICLLWDYDRLWGVFDLGYTTGVFLVDPGPNPSLCERYHGQELPFTWRGIQKEKPDIPLCNEKLNKGKIIFNPWDNAFQGHFEFMQGNGSPGGSLGEGERCVFHAKSPFDPGVVRYYHNLKEAVEMWNKYGPLEEKEGIRQFLSASNRAANLRKRDENSGAITVGEAPKSEGEIISGDSKIVDDNGKITEDDDKTPNDGKAPDEDGDHRILNDGEGDDTSMVSQDSLDNEERVGKVFDKHGRSIEIRFRLDSEGNIFWANFDGDFRDVFQKQGRRKVGSSNLSIPK